MTNPYPRSSETTMMKKSNNNATLNTKNHLSAHIIKIIQQIVLIQEEPIFAYKHPHETDLFVFFIGTSLSWINGLFILYILPNT